MQHSAAHQEALVQLNVFCEPDCERQKKKKNCISYNAQRYVRIQTTMAAPTVRDVTGALRETLSGQGFEVHPLKVGWYNGVLTPSLALPYPDDTLAVVVFSTPSMFEKSFLPFLEGRSFSGGCDLIDQCVRQCVSSAITKCFPEQRVELMFDFELLPSRRPRFLAQTAAHVSGGAFYYQQKDIGEPHWTDRKMFGVCVHPLYGGWFAIRSLLIFSDVLCSSDMQQLQPVDCVPSREGRIQLLESFNLHWQDWTYRDLVPVLQSYSQRQREYFFCPPGERLVLLRSWGFLRDGEELDSLEELQREHNGHG